MSAHDAGPRGLIRIAITVDDRSEAKAAADRMLRLWLSGSVPSQPTADERVPGADVPDDRPR